MNRTVRYALALAVTFFIAAAAVRADSVQAPSAGLSPTAGTSNALALTYYPAIDSNDFMVWQFTDSAMGTNYGTSTNLGSETGFYNMLSINNVISINLTAQNYPWPGGRATFLATSGSNFQWGACAWPSTGSRPTPCPATWNAASANWTDQVSYSVSSWVMTPQAPGTTGSSGAVLFAGPSLATINYGGDTALDVSIGFGRANGVLYTCTSNAGVFTPGVWQHIGFSATRNASPVIYVNGVAQSACATTGNLADLSLTNTATTATQQGGMVNLIPPANGAGTYWADIRFANVVRPASYFQAMYQGMVALTNGGTTFGLATAPTSVLGSAGVVQGNGLRLAASRLTLNKPLAPVDVTGGVTLSITQLLDSSLFFSAATSTVTLPSIRSASAGGPPGTHNLPAVAAGDTFQFSVCSTAFATVTLATATAWTLNGGLTVINTCKPWTCRVTSTTWDADTVSCF